MASARTKAPATSKSSKSRPKPALRGLAGGAGEEWVGGHRTLPLYVQQGEGSFRPAFAAWISPHGVLAASPAHPDEVEQALLGLLRQAIENPLAGKPGRPAAVRLSDARLAPAVAKALGPGVPVRVGPTPELDALAEHFVKHLDQEEPAPERDPWVDSGLDPGLTRALFAAAAGLYRAAPWKAAHGEASLIAADSPALGLKGACVSIIGGAGVDFGLLLFESVAGFEAMRQAGASLEEGASLKGPGASRASLSFEPGAEMPQATRAEIARRGWPVAGPGPTRCSCSSTPTTSRGPPGPPISPAPRPSARGSPA